MNYKAITIFAFCAFSLALVIACGAQNDSLNTEEFLVQELLNDPLTEQIRTNHEKQKNLIMYNELNMDALNEMLQSAPDNDPCNVAIAEYEAPKAAEYFDNMCQHVKLIAAVKEKHPVVETLD